MILISAAFQAITALYILEALINMKTPKELTSTAQGVLGRWAGLLVYASLLIYPLGALTAYVTFGGIAVESLAGLLFWAGALAYWPAGSYIVWRGAKSVGTSELAMVFAFLSLLAAVVAVLVASPHFKTENLAWANWGKTFDVYGIAVFAYGAHFAVASAYKEYTGDVRKFAWGAAMGFFAPGLAYVA
jgi:amino acid permease